MNDLVLLKTQAELVTTAQSSRRGMKWLLIFGACTLFVLINGTTIWFGYKAGLFPNAMTPSWPRILLEQAMVWYPTALVAPAILWAGRRFPLERHRWRKSLFIHFALMLVYDAAVTLISLLFFRLIETWQMSFWPFYLSRTIARLPISIITYGSIIGAGYAIEYYRKYREQQLQSARLQTMLANAQLHALKMQLHPHFLFNTLHAISALMDDDVKTARRMIARLSELLRLTLENAGQQEVTLRQELDALERYLDIEQIRFQDRLRVQMQIAPETLTARVPNLILQPIVENAIRHGIAPNSKAGHIEIHAEQKNGSLELRVRDDGAGLSHQPDTFSEGIGLSNTRARLQQLYGSAQKFDIRNAATGGVIVTLTIPWKESDQ